MIEIPVYVPSRRHQASGRDVRISEQLAATVAPRSAIVGKDLSGDDVPADMVVVYYEGNIHHAAEIVTFADRAMRAYERMREHYPTVAMMAVPRSQLTRTATLCPEYGRVEVAGSREMLGLCRWLGLELSAEHALATDRLATELRATGARA
jgi:hypothetical protein